MNPYESPINFDRRKQVSSHWLRMEFLLLALWGTLPIGLFFGHYLPSALGNFHAAGKIYPGLFIQGIPFAVLLFAWILAVPASIKKTHMNRILRTIGLLLALPLALLGLVAVGLQLLPGGAGYPRHPDYYLASLVVHITYAAVFLPILAYAIHVGRDEYHRWFSPGLVRTPDEPRVVR